MERIDRWPDPAAAALVVAACALIGVPLGWLWQHLSPRTLAVMTSGGFVIPEESESKIAADGRALFLCAAAGLVIGIALWQWRSRRGPWLVLGAVLGATATAGVLALSGTLFSGGSTTGDTGEIFTLPVQVQAPAVLLAAPLMALLSHSIGALFIARDDLGRPEPRGAQSMLMTEAHAVSAVPVGAPGLAGHQAPPSYPAAYPAPAAYPDPAAYPEPAAYPAPAVHQASAAYPAPAPYPAAPPDASTGA